MVSQKTIDRINELYKKQKEQGLTDEEKKEQQELRQEYLQFVKKQVLQQIGEDCDEHANNNSQSDKDK